MDPRLFLHGQTRVNTRREMVCLITRYFNVNRILLLMLGLWPYNQSKLTVLQQILLYSILTSFILIQVSTFPS